MQYVYFGLVPFLLAAWFVYRGWYKKRAMYDGTLGANVLYLLAFTGIYIWLFGFVAGLLTGALVVVIWVAWGNEVRKLELKRTSPSSLAEFHRANYADFEDFMDKQLGVNGKGGRKKGKKSK